MLLSIELIAPSLQEFQLTNGYGHCLAENPGDEMRPVTAPCEALPEKLWNWNSMFESHLCNGKGRCLHIRSPLVYFPDLALTPALSVEGQLWLLTSWGQIQDSHGQCVNSSETTGEVLRVSPCTKEVSLGQQWKKVVV